MRILIFQHLPVENPGVFLEFWQEAGHAWDVVEFDRDAAIPDLAAYDLLAVMGGPMDVWQEDLHPWLRREKAAIRTWVLDMQRPYLGICLGHQLLAEALGGRVGLMRTPEVGIDHVTLTDAGCRDPIFRGLGPALETLQWHGAEVADLPGGVEVLASSPLCPVQAMRFGRHAYGLQFHVEITSETVAAWNEIPDYRASLQRALGIDGAASLGAEVSSKLSVSRGLARRLDENLADIIAAKPADGLATEARHPAR